MNDITALAKPRAPRVRKPAGPVEVLPPATADTPIVRIVPSVPRLIPLGKLRRAPENVRRTRSDEAIVEMAHDIAAHGLIQSLIGYDGEWPEDEGLSFIAGGGRRLGGLWINRDWGLLDDSFLVPVLIRSQEEAIELSLAENLQQRTMSPVDEFLGFKLLMDKGVNSPEGLAARFGYTVRHVRQRLRLAELAPEILDALAERRITIDAAMAYAKSEDRELQSTVFQAHSKGSAYQPHDPGRITRDLKSKGMDTSHRLFKFIGPSAYERAGGAYEDDLFNDPDTPAVLKDPHLVEALAHQHIDFQLIRVLGEAQRDDALSPSIDGFVKVPDLAINNWGTDAKLEVPAGFVRVQRSGDDKVWRTIPNNGIAARPLVGIDPAGALKLWPKIVFIAKDQKRAVDLPAEAAPPTRGLTEAERIAQRRDAAIAQIAWRKGVGPFKGTPLEGRAFWPSGTYIDAFEQAPTADPRMAAGGRLVAVQIFVTDEQMREHIQAAADEYAEREQRRIAAELAAAEAKNATPADLQARADALLAMNPPPEVVLIDGDAWARAEDGSYAFIGDEDDSFVGNWPALLANYKIEDIGETFATCADFAARMQGEA